MDGLARFGGWIVWFGLVAGGFCLVAGEFGLIA